MNTQRPVHLDLTRMKFPPMAIVSILHRISGVILFLLLPFVIDWLHHSLQSEASFVQLQQHMSSCPLTKSLLWIVISAVSFHFFAGLRHMIMDVGVADSVKAARMTAFFVIFLAVIVAVFAGVWLW